MTVIATLFVICTVLTCCYFACLSKKNSISEAKLVVTRELEKEKKLLEDIIEVKKAEEQRIQFETIKKEIEMKKEQMLEEENEFKMHELENELVKAIERRRIEKDYQRREAKRKIRLKEEELKDLILQKKLEKRNEERKQRNERKRRDSERKILKDFVKAEKSGINPKNFDKYIVKFDSVKKSLSKNQSSTQTKPKSIETVISVNNLT
ncbi:hypothetical protein HELRODRAFT_165160 [Helobdella robusta]|uniref:Uncharacterized protein n=1 Tax=Helobdella robusta TaxID=6412 RepID=T1EWC6_HELRO|nr:hypothetical protein HELRODRAFT_165160 [Helobdella robusta]ESN93005.1 hypothetical protein HELRODRAFT_165160 [Helobdella robusta]